MRDYIISVIREKKLKINKLNKLTGISTRNLYAYLVCGIDVAGTEIKLTNFFKKKL